MRRISAASMPHGPATASGGNSRTSARSSSSPFRWPVTAAGVVESLLDERAGDPGEQQGVRAGPDEVVLVGLLGGARAARVDHDDLAAALADRAQAAAHVGRGEQAAVRDERVGAEQQQVLDSGRRRGSGSRASCRTCGPPRPASASGRRSRRCRGSASRASASARARTGSPRGCGRSGCPGRRRPSCARARRGWARGGGRSPRTPRPSSPRRAHRRGGRAASSAGPDPRAAA